MSCWRFTVPMGVAEDSKKGTWPECVCQYLFPAIRVKLKRCRERLGVEMESWQANVDCCPLESLQTRSCCWSSSGVDVIPGRVVFLSIALVPSIVPALPSAIAIGLHDCHQS